MAKRIKLWAREKKEKEKTKLYAQISKTMHLQTAINLYGIDKVVWAMNAFTRKQQQTKRLHKKERQLQAELNEVQSKIG